MQKKGDKNAVPKPDESQKLQGSPTTESEARSPTTVSKNSKQKSLTPTDIWNIKAYVCQELCAATWTVGKAKDRNRFYCWYAAFSYEEYRCQLVPRLDIHDRSALGPDHQNYGYYSLGLYSSEMSCRDPANKKYCSVIYEASGTNDVGKYQVFYADRSNILGLESKDEGINKYVPGSRGVSWQFSHCLFHFAIFVVSIMGSYCITDGWIADKIFALQETK